MKSDKIYHIISNTHWDREWRFPFQRNRQMLVEMMDNLINILMNEPDYKAFHLDSQSILIEDYLEIKPQNREIIKKLVKERRIFIGPWFILPDEFQVGGENLIRNLLLGHKICKKYGRVSKTGYSPFSWGQISQLPQIYAGFGIDVIMFYRGVNAKESPSAEFLWEGADGTTALTSRFSTMPRYNFYFYVYRKVLYDENTGDAENKWNRKGSFFRMADPDTREDYYNINPSEEYYIENIKNSVEQIIKEQADDFTTPHVIWMEGHDSSGADSSTVKIIKDIRREFPSLDVRHSTLEDYAQALKSSADFSALRVVKGERRSAQFNNRSGNLYGYTLSARMYLKQKNFEAEKWLLYYAEPFDSAASVLGAGTENKYLEKAWNYLIQNSAHDSIGGCSLDEVHDDMINRYKQSIEISKGVLSSSLKFIVKNINTPENNSGINIVVFNPLPLTRNEVVELLIDIPEEKDEGSFSLISHQGEKQETVILQRFSAEPVAEQLTDRPMFFKMIRYRCLANLKNIPSLGYSTLSVIPGKALKKINNIARVVNNLPVMENEYVRIKINKNGTINFLNKSENLEIRNTGYIYDEGEAGHAWINKPVKPFITTLRSKPVIKITENNSLNAECLVKYILKLPQKLKDRTAVKGKYIKQIVECYISLNKNSRRADYKIRTFNQAESHRLRIIFPTGIKSDFSFGEGQFDVVRRSTGRPDTRDWIEQPMYDFPMHHFTDLSDGKKGAAVLVSGLKEYEILPDRHSIAITLLRCFEYVIQPSSIESYPEMKGSQCPGLHTFRLSFYPHKGSWQNGNTYNEALNFNYNLITVEAGKGEGSLPPSSSFIRIEKPGIIMSCFKKAEDGSSYILRLFNPGNRRVETNIITLFKILKAEKVNLEELVIDNITLIDENKIRIRLGKKEIYTIRLSLTF